MARDESHRNCTKQIDISKHNEKNYEKSNLSQNFQNGKFQISILKVKTFLRNKLFYFIQYVIPLFFQQFLIQIFKNLKKIPNIFV